MVDGPGVRWAGYSHQEILDMVNAGPGPALTEEMEARLNSAAQTLADTADTVNAALQRLNAGEWQGGAASAAAGAMQVVRDFDDGMHYASVGSEINVYSQSDSARVARANVPPKVEVGPRPEPTGTPMDIVIVTDDHEDQQRAAKDAENRAREVMADYTTMTTTRVSNMKQLSVPPQVVFDVSGGTAEPPPGGPRPPGDGPPPGPGGPDGGSPGPGGGGPAPGPGGSSVDTGQPSPPPAGDQPGVTPPGSTEAAEADSPRQPTTATPTSTPPGPATDAPRGTSGVPVGGIAGGPGSGGGGRSPGVGAGPGVRGEPGARGAQPGAGARGGGMAEAFGRSGARGAGLPGMAPMGAAGAARGDEDKEHDVKYGVPSAAFFEPDNDDGVWRDPYRPGSYVAPPAIGDEDEEE